jgi:UDP:flavonoid glycosyltransferase YjiC (YdhE family)
LRFVKVLIQTVGSAGDTHPFIGVGKAMLERGHTVVLFGNEVFADITERAGLSFVQIGDAKTFHRTIADPDVWNPRKGTQVVVRPVVNYLRDTIANIEAHLDGASVLVASTLGFAARIVRELHDVPLITAHLAPMSFRSNFRIPRTEVMWVKDSSPTWIKGWWWSFIDFLADRAVGPELNQVRAERGLEPVSRIFDRWMVYSPDRTLGLFPDWFGPPQPDWPESLHLTGFPLYDESDHRPINPDLQEWLALDAPPLVFAAGSPNVQGSGFFSTALSVSRALDLRAVFVTSHPVDLPSSLPPTVRHEHYVPFSRLLPRARALVSHGGVGTCAQALAAGIPHLVAHMNFDQRDNGTRLDDLGAGGLIRMRKFRGRKGLKAVEAILDKDVATRAKTFSERIDRETALDATCEEVETVAHHAQGPA